MLILSRSKNEAINIGDDIRVVITAIHGNQVRVGIEAPKHIQVHREEITKRIKQDKLDAQAAQPQPPAASPNA